MFRLLKDWRPNLSMPTHHVLDDISLVRCFEHK
jgi:hypothetical protein